MNDNTIRIKQLPFNEASKDGTHQAFVNGEPVTDPFDKSVKWNGASEAFAAARRYIIDLEAT